MLLMGLDIGTTGVKAVVFDAGGRALSRAFREHRVDSDNDGRAEQDPDEVWLHAKTVMREALAAAGTTTLAAVCASLQGDAVIPLGKDGQVLHPAILGMDYRCLAELPECEKRFGGWELFLRTGMRPHPINSFIKMLWLRRNRPKVFAESKSMASYSDFILRRMGLPGVMDQCMASRSMAYNLEKSDWDDDILAAFDFPRSLLALTAPSGTPIGPMAAEVAKELGLSKAPLVVAGGHDQAVAAIGAGAIVPDIAVASTGTAEVMSRYLAEPLLTKKMYDSYYPCYCSAMGEGYFTFALNHSGGLAFRWFRDQWCGEETAKAAAAGRDAYAMIVDEMPEGPSGLYTMPHFTGSGTPDCDMSSRAAIVGMNLTTDRPRAGLALLEGLTFDLRSNLDRMRELGMETSRIRNVGGGSRSRRWVQLKADILDIPVEIMTNADAACGGAAALAGWGSGVYSSVTDGVSRLVSVADVIEPDASSARRYSECYAVYRELCNALRPFYRSIYHNEG